MVRPLFPLIAIALAGTACAPEGRRKDDTPVVVSAIGSADLLVDPASKGIDGAQAVALAATAQGLVRYDANGQIEPALAARWNVFDDARSYIFRLGEARWANGQPVTAEEIVRALRRAVAAHGSGRLGPHLAVIDEIVEMTPQVIEVRLKHPRPDLLNLFAQPELSVARGRAIGGAGPFRIMPGQRDGLLLRPMEEPGDDPAAKPAPEQHVRLRGEWAAAAIARFRAGASDLVLGGSVLDWPIVEQAGIAPENIRFDPAMGLFGLAVLRRDGFLSTPQNRAAVAMAINRADLTSAIAPNWTTAETILPAQLDSAAPPAPAAWATVPPDARQALAAQRVREWQAVHRGPVEIALALPAGPGATLVWGHLAASLIAVGITPRRVGLGDPQADLELIDAVAPYDSGRWYLATACRACSEDAATLIAAARDAPDLYNRTHRIAEADAMLASDVSFLPIAQPLRYSIVALRLSAWRGNARAWHPLNHLRKE
ncbi:ABC transporter substrate-binding protein [Sphingomonas pokkalii]|uniref:ABC transporter substrate-binding protein n=1 Tax=Sphingomonas pokkalii TaxID=2175090 RepID=A0A2U0SEA3_9SPHN|nr:ABC transporter substrate-binding protein [Sphingomonas pokkalii]PVX29624.1 ABC transporter substrate-binding protein [Sphingomonas pokkalii]